MMSRDNIKLQKDFFNALAPSWRDGEDMTIADIAEICAPISIEAGDRVLDVACGSGVLDEYLLSRQALVDALDVSEEMIAKAKRNEANDGVNYIVGDLYTHKGEYDLLLVFDAYPHFLDKEAFAETAFSLLAPLGELWIFFDDSAEGINSHHQAIDAGLSCPLLSVECEAAKLSKYFDVIYRLETENRYYLGLKRK